MKKTTLIMGVLLIGFSSCKEVDKLTQFSMDYNNEVVIPASAVIGLPLDILTPKTSTNYEQKFSQNDTRKDLIEEIKLTELVLTVKNPESGNLEFLEKVEVYIAADGLSEQKVAWADVPEGVGKTISLTTSDINLKEYIMKDEFTLRVKTTTDKTIKEDHTLDVYSKFFVDAKVLGL